MRKNYFLSLLLLMIAFWKVEAREREISKESAPISNTMVAALPTPTELAGQTVTNVLGTRINLVWRDNASGETGFEVAYSTNNGVSYTFVPVAGENFDGYKVFSLTGLTPGTEYKIAVRVVKTAGGTTDPGCTPLPGEPSVMNTLYSCWTPTITKVAAPTVPRPPVNLQSFDNDITQTTAKISFTDDSDNEDDFLIQKRIGLGAWEDVTYVAGSPGVGTRKEYVVTNLFSATIYQFRVFSHNSTDWSSVSSNIKQIVTLPFAPAAPTDLMSPWQELDNIRLEWYIRSNNEDYFIIERSTNGGPFIVIANDWFKGINFYEDKNAKEGVCYAYRVKAHNQGGDSGWSNIVNVCAAKRVAPPALYDLQATTVSTKRIDLNWSNPVNSIGKFNKPVSTEVYRASEDAPNDFFQIAIITNTDAFTYVDSTAKPKTKYWYKILSSNNFGQSPYSNIASATTLGPPFMPKDLQAMSTKDSLGNDILKIHWTDASDDEDYFVLERATDVNFTTNVLTTNLVEDYTSATSIPFEEGVTYYFRIKAVNIHGESGFTDWTSVTTFYTAIANAPYALKATAALGSVTLKWGDDSNKEEGFEVERSTDGTNFGKVITTERNATTFVDNTVAANTKYWYRVRAINPKGPSAYTDVVVVSTPAATNGLAGGANLIANDAWQVYPNPTADAVKVTLPESMQNQVGVVTIIDRMNREVVKMKLDSNQNEYQFDLSNFTEGTYTISIRTATQQISKRVYKY